MRCAAAVAFLLLPAGAWGQTLTVDTSEFHRANDDNDPDQPDLDGGDPDRVREEDGINLDECTRGEVWHYQVTTSGALGKTLFVYTGDSCADLTGRDDDAIDCKRIDSEDLGSSIEVWKFDLAANQIANIDGEECEDLDDNLRVWFVILESETDETAAASASSPAAGDIRVLTKLPDAPTDVTAGAGENRAEVDWEAATDGDRFYVACDAQTAAAAEEPAFDEAGQEVCSGDPPTAGFAAGATFDRAWRCDSSHPFADGLASESASIAGLDNEVQVFFAVVSVDEVGNPSVLSELACATPKPVDDFFELYRRNGGRGGDGLCSAAPGAGGSGAFAGAVLAALALSRRRAR